MERLNARLCVLVIALLWPFAPLAHAEPGNGWWWNPNESGRGFYIQTWDDVLFMSGYFYEEDGRSTWLISAGGFDTPYSYTGRLLKVTGGQTLFGEYQAPTETDVGEITIEFTDDTHGTLVWPGGTIAIERQVFATGAASFQPTGWWWNPDESGRGYSIEVQGDFLFLAAFMYDDAGNPIWFISAGRMTSPTHYEGALLQVTGGQTLTGSYHPPAAETPVGTVTIDFASLEEATLTFSDAIPPAARASSSISKAARFKSIQIGPQRPRSTTVTTTWQGFYKKEETRNVVGYDSTLTWRGQVTFQATTPAPGNPPGNTVYALFAGTLSVTISGAVAGGQCFQSGQGSVDLTPSNGYLKVYADGNYEGSLLRSAVDLDASLTCGGISLPINPSPDFDLIFNGHVTTQRKPLQPIARHLTGKQGGASWDFTAIAP